MKTFVFEGRDDYMARWHDAITEEDISAKPWSKYAIKFHDRFYDWEKHPVVGVMDDDGKIMAVLFHNFASTQKYISVHNLCTLPSSRGKGAAVELMKYAVINGNKLGAERLRLNSDSGAIGFYNKLGFISWGITGDQDFYCDMPLLSSLEAYKDIKDMDIYTLLGNDKSNVINHIKKRIRENYSIDDKIKHLKKQKEEHPELYLYEKFMEHINRSLFS